MKRSTDQGYLDWGTKFCYGVGHVFNDLCASMWFSYLLVYFEKVLEFEPDKAGLVLLIGQLADGFSTPVVGIFSDRENKITACANYGRRKVWHLTGTIFVLVSFPFIFSPCLGCEYADHDLQLIYYCLFVVVFQFGWACVQISHLSLIPEMSSRKNTRTELNSIRYSFTVLSNLSVFTVAFLLLGKSDHHETNDNFNYTSTTIPSFTTFNATEDPGSNLLITPADADEFRNMALFCICTGIVFSFIFHIGVKEPPFVPYKKDKPAIEIENSLNINSPPKVHRMQKLDWFKEIAFYQVALLYMCTRLYVNLYQVYIPMYVQDSLELTRTAVASVPFTMYSAGFLGSLVMKPINKKIGRKGTFSLGCCIGLMGCTWIALGKSESFKVWGVYLAASLLGIGGSTVLITSLSITADLIGYNVEGGAFVYGFMSLVDKFSNGIVVMLIQNAHRDNLDFYRHVISYACGSACLLGLLVCLSLIPVKVNERRGASKRLASIIEEPMDNGEIEQVLKTNNQDLNYGVSTIYSVDDEPS